MGDTLTDAPGMLEPDKSIGVFPSIRVGAGLVEVKVDCEFKVGKLVMFCVFDCCAVKGVDNVAKRPKLSELDGSDVEFACI